MSTTWKLQEWLKAERGVTRATDISKRILKRTGFKISNQAISDLFNTQPEMLRLETIQAICDTFNCRLSDFCDITPHNFPSPTGLTKPGRVATEKKVTKLRALSTNLEQLKGQLGLISTSEAAQLCASSLQGINSLVNTGRIRHELLLDHTYVYKSDVLSTPVRKCPPPGTHQPRPQTNPTPITLSLHPYSVKTNEDLRSFLSRVQFAAISKAIEVEGSNRSAARRLHYTRPALTTLRRRLRSKGITTNSSSATTRQPQRQTKILLPHSLFIIKETEGLQTFLARIQLATITKTIAVEGSKAKAAVRLGYTRTSFLTLLRLLTVGSRSLKNLSPITK